MQRLTLFVWAGLMACCTTMPKEPRLNPSKNVAGIQVQLKNTGKIEAKQASFLVLRESKASGPLSQNPQLLTRYGRYAQEAGRDVRIADDILKWSQQASPYRYLLVIQDQGTSSKAGKFCYQLQIQYFLPQDLQEAAVEPSFRQDLDSCAEQDKQLEDLSEAALRVGIRHLGREGSFLHQAQLATKRSLSKSTR